MKAFTSSYSASRAALIEAWKVFRMRRKWFVADFCNPVWELFMDEAVALGRIYAPGYFTNPILRKAYLGARWTGPTQGQLDPVKEVTAEILKNQNGYATHEESTITLNGSDFDENINQLARESEKIANVKTNFIDTIKNKLYRTFIEEDRYIAIGMVGEVLFVVFTERKENIRFLRRGYCFCPGDMVYWGCLK